MHTYTQIHHKYQCKDLYGLKRTIRRTREYETLPKFEELKTQITRKMYDRGQLLNYLSVFLSFLPLRQYTKIRERYSEQA